MCVCVCVLCVCVVQERVCEDSASFDLTSTDVSLCISDLDIILKAKKEELEFSTGILYILPCNYYNSAMLTVIIIRIRRTLRVDF